MRGVLMVIHTAMFQGYRDILRILRQQRIRCLKSMRLKIRGYIHVRLEARAVSLRTETGK